MPRLFISILFFVFAVGAFADVLNNPIQSEAERERHLICSVADCHTITCARCGGGTCDIFGICVCYGPCHKK